MNKASTMFLKGAIFLMALVVLVLCLFILPPAIMSNKVDGLRPILIGMYITAIPFFIALYQALKLLGYIDKNTAFSHLSVKALKNIKYCAIIIGTWYTFIMPYLHRLSQKNDAPGVVIISLVIIFASFVIAVFSALLQQVLQNAIAIKSENDLTV